MVFTLQKLSSELLVRIDLVSLRRSNQNVFKTEFDGLQNAPASEINYHEPSCDGLRSL